MGSPPVVFVYADAPQPDRTKIETSAASFMDASFSKRHTAAGEADFRGFVDIGVTPCEVACNLEVTWRSCAGNTGWNGSSGKGEWARFGWLRTSASGKKSPSKRCWHA